jgi:glycosyltransferase involved in cell wall biosynthesis
MNNRRKLILVGQTPPPHNGQAKMIQQMIDGLRDEFDLLHIRMAYSDSVVSAGKFGVSKIAHLFDLIRATRRALKKYPGAVLYYPPASPNWIPVLRDIIYLLAVRPVAGKVVFHFHSGGLSRFAQTHRMLKPLMIKAYAKADWAIELGASCPRDGEFFRARQVRIVPNGIDVPSDADHRQPVIDNLKILYVGIHTETKGLFDLLSAANELKRRGVEFEIRTAGLWYTDQERVRFEALRLQWNLQEEVQTPGQKTGADLQALYRWADVFFFPTFYPWETCGIVQLEAMAYGLPVVSSDWQGPQDIVLNGKTGFLCPVHDISAFADALQKLSADRSLIRQLGAAGRERYQSNYTAACFIANLKNILNEVCA